MFRNAVVVTSPTCNRTGIEESTCSICLYANRITLDRIDHNYVSREYEGYVDYTCTMCGDTYYEIIEIPTSVTESIIIPPVVTEPIDTQPTESINTTTVSTETIGIEQIGTEQIGAEESSTTESNSKESNKKETVTISCQGMICSNLIVTMLIAIFTVNAIIIMKKKKDM